VPAFAVLVPIPMAAIDLVMKAAAWQE